MHLYISRFGRNVEYPPHTGQKFFLCLEGCSDPQHPAAYSQQSILRGSSDLFLCPSSGSQKGMDYRGPRQFTPPGNPGPYPSALADNCPADRVIGCDKPGNHKDGGNALRFDGSVRFLEGGEFKKALQTTE
jgi:prepilin-type processing-associated H-X9-DG protein